MTESQEIVLDARDIDTYTKELTPRFSVNIASALAAAQAAMPTLVKDSENPHLRNKYASLAAVLDVITGPLRDAGLVIYQDPTVYQVGNAIHVLVKSYLIHCASGEFIMASLPMALTKTTPQDVGTAITYARRYLLLTQCGLAPEDDDGNGASGVTGNNSQNGNPPRNNSQNGKQQQQQQQAKTKTKTKADPNEGKATQEQIAQFTNYCKEVYGDQAKTKALELVDTMSSGKAKTSAELTTSQAQRLIAGLQKKLDEKATAAAQAAEPVAFDDDDSDDDNVRPEWKNPAQAQAWAVENALVEDQAAALAAWMAIVKGQFGGTIKPAQLPAALDAFYADMLATVDN